MTQDQFISTYNGQFVQFENDVVDKGQCLPLVQVYMQQVQGIANPPVTPSAKNYWLLFSQLGLGQWYDQIPAGQEQSGDLMVYGPHGTFTDGHIAICLGGGEVFEQNADPDSSPAHTYARPDTYLIGNLRLKGVNMFNEGDRVNINDYLYGQDLGLHGNVVGQDWKTAMYNIFTSSDFAFNSRLNAGDVTNIKDVLHIDYSSQLNQVWKSVVYAGILKNPPAVPLTSVVINGVTYTPSA